MAHPGPAPLNVLAMTFAARRPLLPAAVSCLLAVACSGSLHAQAPLDPDAWREDLYAQAREAFHEASRDGGGVACHS